MAKRSRGTFSMVKTLLALIGLLAIPVTYGLVTGWNPLPGLGDKVSAGLDAKLGGNHTLADPAAAWTVRIGDTPTWAASAGGVMIIGSRGGVEARGATTGTPLWARTVDYAAVAGSDTTGDAVLLLGARGHGYQAVNPRDGAERWKDPTALGV